MSDETTSATLAERPAAKIGRPTIFTPELAQRCVDFLREGNTLRALAREDWAPGHATLYRWMDADAAFRDALARARADSVPVLVEASIDGIAAVDTDSPFGAARVAKARDLFGATKYLAGVLNPAWRETQQIDARVAVAIIAAFPDLTPRPLASVAVDPALPPAPQAPQGTYEPA